MVKPISFRAEDADVRKARPCVYLVRAASATLRSFVTGATPANAVKAMFGNDVVTDLILRAPTAPAAISGTAGWAQSLAGVAIYDLIQSIVSLSAAADVPDIGRRTSKGEAELQRCLMPLEVFEIEGSRIVRRSPRDLDIPCKQYPRALGQVGIYCWPNKKAVTREVVET